jgi:hypothetical protein
MTHTLARAVLAAGVLAASIGLTASDSAAQNQGGLTTYRNERHGFTVSYPAAQFLALPAATEDARLFVSNDDKARLLVGTLENTDNKTVAQYQQFLLRESYAGAAVDYAPLRDKWFVLSGVRNGTAFYQRVTFSCGGRKINSWAMLFPEGQKATYEPIIEQVHRSYSVSDRNCS